MRNLRLNMLLKAFLCSFFLLISVLAQAQGGSWNPPGAQHVFPRTILSATDLPAVRDSLNNPVRLQIYTALYNQALVNAPSGNTSTANRRSRAEQAKNAAFIAQINRVPVAGSTSVLPAAQFLAVSNKSRNLLQTSNTNVEAVFQYTEWQWRSKELIDYLIAYDLLRGAGIPADSLLPEKAKLQEFAANLYSAATSNPGFYIIAKNNHSLMTSAALGMAAVVLNDATGSVATAQPVNWINTAMFNIDNVLWHDAQSQSDPDTIAGYAEGPYYFKYAFLNLLPFLKAMGNFLPDGSLNYTYSNVTRSIRNPYYDPTYDLLYTWIASITMPDGRLPALEDSFINMSMPELVLTGKSRFVKPLFLQNLAPNQGTSLSSQLTSTVDMRAAWLGSLVLPTPHADTLVYLPESGNLIFRNTSDHLSGYLHLYGKHGDALNYTGGHNQGDAASFLLYSHGQLLALDPGYLSFDQREVLGNAANHNLILVDGAGPLIGTSGNANDAQAYIQNGFEIKDLQYGEVATAYGGAEITRKAMAVRGKYYVIADQINAPQPHEYTWQLHGYGLENGTAATGNFSSDFSNNKGIWQKNGVSLEAHVSGSATTNFSADTAQHELIYNTTENHTVMQVKQTAPNANFVSVLQPYVTQPALAYKHQQFGMAVTLIEDSGLNDVVIAKTDTSLQQLNLPALPVQTNGLFTFISQDSTGTIHQALLQYGSVLMLNNEEIAQTNNRTTVAWTETDSVTIQGYTNSPATLQLKTPGFPGNVTGAGVSSWSYSTSTNRTEIVFSEPGAFQINLSDTLVSVLPANKKVSVSAFPNPFQGKFMVTADGFVEGEIVKIEITDLTGKVIYQKLQTAKNKAIQTEINPKQTLPNGVLLLMLRGESGQTAVRKIISQ